jgi:hypothetical protein
MPALIAAWVGDLQRCSGAKFSADVFRESFFEYLRISFRLHDHLDFEPVKSVLERLGLLDDYARFCPSCSRCGYQLQPGQKSPLCVCIDGCNKAELFTKNAGDQEPTNAYFWGSHHLYMQTAAIFEKVDRNKVCDMHSKCVSSAPRRSDMKTFGVVTGACCPHGSPLPGSFASTKSGAFAVSRGFLLHSRMLCRRDVRGFQRIHREAGASARHRRCAVRRRMQTDYQPPAKAEKNSAYRCCALPTGLAAYVRAQRGAIAYSLLFLSLTA